MRVNYYYKTGLFIAAVISLLFFLPGFLEGRDAVPKFLISYLISVSYIILMWLFCAKIHQQKSSWYILPSFRQYSKSINFVIISELIVGVLITILFIYLTNTYGSFSGPAGKVKQGFKQSLHGAINFNIFLLIIHSIILSVYLATSTADKQRKLILEKEKLEKENIRAQFESLRQQVNPHFLFNSLTSLQVLAKEKSELVEDYVAQLSNVYRYLLKHRKQDLVSLKNELEFIKSYLYLLNIRFEKGLKVEIDVNEKYHNSSIPPLTLQILIENAVKHNIISESYPLHIQIYSNGEDRLAVSNNKQPRQMVEGSSHFGLYNLNLQYKFFFGKEIIINKGDGRFCVYIPISDNKLS
jgi:sensor histidine kinase YesM